LKVEIFKSPNMKLKSFVLFFFTLFIIVLFLSCSSTFRYDKIFQKGKEYYYRTVYIDSIGDTITNEVLIMKPLNRRWLGQLRIQEAVKYSFCTDTFGYKNFVSPDPSMRKLKNEYFEKKGRNKIKKSENTGAVNNDNYFFLHPPRVNQYFMLRYSAYPYLKYSCLTDSVSSFELKLSEIRKYNHIYEVKPLSTDSLNSSEKLWEFNVESKVTNLSDYWKQYHIFDSKSVMIFSKESGFIMMHHTFENGIRINFDLIEIKQNLRSKQ
jgi:hypothetical protein